MNESAEAAIVVEGLHKSFVVPRVDGDSSDSRREHAGGRDRLHVLRDINLSIPRGQTIGLIGANGSGKSTLLKILAGVMNHDSGEARVMGRLGALLEVSAGFHPDLTGEENARLSGSLIGLSRGDMSRYMADIVEFSGLERFMDMPVRHFSSGMVVRLGFATAIQLKPDVLLLDETLAVGDAAFQAKAIARIREMQRAGKTLILVSHNAELILELAGRVIWLNEGRIQMDGAPREVLTAYRNRIGALNIGDERLMQRLLGGVSAIRVREGEKAIRIVGVSLSGKVETAKDDRPALLELKSTESLGLQVQFELNRTPDNLVLDVYFHRDDHRDVAASRLMLKEIVKEHRPLVTLQLSYVPIHLLQGDYTITVVISRLNGDGFAEDTRRADRILRIVTPPPRDFRIAAQLEGHWNSNT